MVQVVDVSSVSMELCGGTHVATATEIGVAAGILRIDGVEGGGLQNAAQRLVDELDDVAAVLLKGCRNGAHPAGEPLHCSTWLDPQDAPLRHDPFFMEEPIPCD